MEINKEKMNNIINLKINELIESANQNNYNENDIQKILDAIEFAKNKHDNQLRSSGEPYITHPISTAIILIKWKMDITSIIAGVLHDVLEDTLTLDEEIKDKFGNEILLLVKYVTKVSLYSKQNRQDNREKSKIEKDYIVQVFLSMSVDIRAIIIKLADRYHNMLTIKYLKHEKQIKIAEETLEVYANIAGRIGMYKLKTELQDLSFAVLKPHEYNDIKNKLKELILANEVEWLEIKNKIISILNQNNQVFEIKERIKGIYSTYDKIQSGHNIDNIHDIYALRIILSNSIDCYKVLGLINMNFSYLPNAFKDFISMPKYNLYQSLHTTINVKNTLVEVQIRTNDMDNIAEYGVASHWSYKEHSEDKFNSYQTILDNVNKNILIQEVIKNPYNEEHIKRITKEKIINVLVLNNETKYSLNTKSSCLDLAIKHNQNTFVNLKTIYVNGRISSFDTILKQGDVIKFEYANTLMINSTWINFTNSSSSLTLIKKLLENIKNNDKDNVNHFIKKVKQKLGIYYCGDYNVNIIINKKLNIKNIDNLIKKLPAESLNDIDFVNIFDKRKNINKLAFNNFYKKYYVKFLKPKYFQEINEIYFCDLKFPDCCNKIPDLQVVGYVDKKNYLIIHNINCEELKKIKKNIKLIPLNWDYNELEKYPKFFKYHLNFDCSWTPSIGNVITSKMNKYKITLSSININRNKKNNIANIKMLLYVTNIQWIKYFINDISNEINILSNINF